ncbi:MAG: 7-cyano-7-deazaguanine synthase [Actinobacteria bacterium]|nr:7-cyano-7-deazaguanine synthase [Actinomycetota bacterium]MCA1807016.1 7-cyano-7-deazaguanine synthase [Actinomycetota bacterium]
MKSKKLMRGELDIDRNEKVALSLSGGLDSVTLLHYLVDHVGPENVYPISFDYNQRHDYELLCAAHHVGDLGIPKNNYSIVDVSFMGEIAKGMSAMVRSDVKVPSVQQALGDPQPASYMPFRNLIFSSLVACYAESNDVKNVALGIQRVDQLGYWDTSREFVDKLQEVFNLNRKNTLRMLTPFVESSKVDEIELGLELGVEYQYTWTCYNGPHTRKGVPWDKDPKLSESAALRFANLGNAYACGLCASCADRKAAFKSLGASDMDVLYLEESVAKELYPET